MSRVRNFEGHLIPTATTCRVFYCGDPGCGHAHVIGFDAKGVAFAEIVLSETIINKALDAIHLGEVQAHEDEPDGDDYADRVAWQAARALSKVR